MRVSKFGCLLAGAWMVMLGCGWNGPAIASDATDAADVTTTHADRDFSALLMPKTPFIGFVGKDYQRLYIRFVSVTRDPRDHHSYVISGFALTRGVQTPFTGRLVIRALGRVTQMHYGSDDELKGAGIEAEGTAFGDYDFAETSGGRFSGAMTLDWYIDRHGKLLYDDMEIYSDGYSNNQYTGHWQASPSSPSVVANWGEYRVPQSGDLDTGAAEFAPNPKYANKGWAAPVPRSK